jgi:predicted amidohydrolase
MFRVSNCAGRQARRNLTVAQTEAELILFPEFTPTGYALDEGIGEQPSRAQIR